MILAPTASGQGTAMQHAPAHEVHRAADVALLNDERGPRVRARLELELQGCGQATAMMVNRQSSQSSQVSLG